MGFGFPSYNQQSNGVGLVGEALGEQEALEGEVFRGSAGWQLDHVLKRAGIKREEFAFIDNVLHCRPPNNKLNWSGTAQQAIHQCAHFLDDTIQQMKPKAIIALGGTALGRLTQQGGMRILRNRGFIFDSPYNIPIVGTYHPSYLLPRKREKSSAKYTWVMIMDIRKAIRVAEEKRWLVPQHYLMDPTIDQAREFMGEYIRTPDVKLAWDIETLYKMANKNEQTLKLENAQTVTRLSMAFRPGYSMSIPYDPLFRREIIQPIMRMNRPKTGWNSSGFDLPIVIFQEGWEMNGILYDAMDQFHVFQPNIERNLEFATSILTDHLRPWKHLSQSDPVYYSCVDGDATISNSVQLDLIMNDIQVPDYGV